MIRSLEYVGLTLRELIQSNKSTPWYMLKLLSTVPSHLCFDDIHDRSVCSRRCQCNEQVQYFSESVTKTNSLIDRLRRVPLRIINVSDGLETYFERAVFYRISGGDYAYQQLTDRIIDDSSKCGDNTYPVLDYASSDRNLPLRVTVELVPSTKQSSDPV